MSDRGLLYLGIPICTVIFMLLVGCGEPASCWSDQRATFRPCDEVRRDQINREIDKRQPAECSWKEIDQPGDWQQTCDDNQKRLQR
jgi:hypothetical protein